MSTQYDEKIPLGETWLADSDNCCEAPGKNRLCQCSSRKIRERRQNFDILHLGQEDNRSYARVERTICRAPGEDGQRRLWQYGPKFNEARSQLSRPVSVPKASIPNVSLTVRGPSSLAQLSARPGSVRPSPVGKRINRAAGQPDCLRHSQPSRTAKLALRSSHPHVLPTRNGRIHPRISRSRRGGPDHPDSCRLRDRRRDEHGALHHFVSFSR